MIQAKVVADSVNPFGDRITSMLVTFPRIILSEFNTHRMFSRNSASSRAIPSKRMIQMIKENPFRPIAWQKEHIGMQGTEYLLPAQDEHDKEGIENVRNTWEEAKDAAIYYAEVLIRDKATKQLANRLLEPFMWTTVLVTATEWSNFFELRCPQYQNTKYLGDKAPFFKSKKDYLAFYEEEGNVDSITWLKRNRGQAEIHMMALAEAMWDARNESKPRELKAGEWHIPFEHNISISQEETWNLIKGKNILKTPYDTVRIEISTAMAARTSYTTVGEEKEVSNQTLVGIHDRMIAATPRHSSPMEHCNKAMGEEHLDNFLKIENGETEVGWCKNFKGFISYRWLLENERL